MTQGENTAGELPALLIELNETVQAAETAGGRLPLETSRYLRGRQEQIEDRVRQIMNAEPAVLTALESREQQKIVAYIGVLAALETLTSEEEQIYVQATQRQLGRSAAILSQIRVFLPPREEEVQEHGIVVELPSSPEEEETAEAAKYDIVINNEGDIIINGLALELLPAQRFILEFMIEQDEPFRESLIYHHPEFERIIREEGQKSPVTAAYGNARRGLERRFGLAGLDLNDFAPISGGGPRSRVISRASPIEVSDLRIMSQANELTDFIFDQLSAEHPVDIESLTKEFFGIDRIGSGHRSVIESALGSLRKEIEGQGIRIDLEGSLLTLTVTQQTEMAHALEDQRGKFIALEDTAVVYENERVALSEKDKAMLGFITTADPRNGVTKAAIKELIRVKGLDTKDFDIDFSTFRKKMGPALERILPKGRRGIATRYTVPRDVRTRTSRR